MGVPGITCPDTGLAACDEREGQYRSHIEGEGMHDMPSMASITFASDMDDAGKTFTP
jgi:hypothetical protein